MTTPRSAELRCLLQMATSIACAAARRPDGLVVARLPQSGVKPVESAGRRIGRVAIDFHAVEPHQREIDRRLANWASWCNGCWGAPSTSPMFRLTPAPPRVRSDFISCGPIIDEADARKIAKAVAALPKPHRAAIQWAYIRPCSPKKACQALGTSLGGLALFLRDARQMLINRGA